MLELGAIEAADTTALEAFRQFEDLWHHRKATRDDFFNLVKLLCHVGCSTEAEYLLRTNLLLVSEDEQSLYEDKDRLALYLELFGTAKQEELAVAIAAFTKQFCAQLRSKAGASFFVGYNTEPRCDDLEKYGLRNELCAVHFEYDHKDYIEAQVWSLTAEDQLIFLRWINGRWEIIGTGYSCQVY